MKKILWTLLISLSLGVLQSPSLAQDESSQPIATEDSSTVSPRVQRSAVCTAIEEHEPVGAGEQFPAGTERLYCFTQIADGDGQTVIHAWIHEGTTRARVELNIGSDLWRTYSSKDILPGWSGQWQVKVLTEAGAVLQTIDFSIGETP
jgi:hypothetical protein